MTIYSICKIWAFDSGSGVIPLSAQWRSNTTINITQAARLTGTGTLATIWGAYVSIGV